jgi:hypothetical protein
MLLVEYRRHTHVHTTFYKPKHTQVYSFYVFVSNLLTQTPMLPTAQWQTDFVHAQGTQRGGNA